MLSAAEQMRLFVEQEPLLRPDHARPRADGRVLWVGAATRSSFRRGSTRSRAAWSSRTREFRSERERAGAKQSHRAHLNRRPPGPAVPPVERKTLRHKEKRPEQSPAATRKGGVSDPESATQMPRTPGRKRPRRGADSRR